MTGSINTAKPKGRRFIDGLLATHPIASLLPMGVITLFSVTATVCALVSLVRVVKVCGYDALRALRTGAELPLLGYLTITVGGAFALADGPTAGEVLKDQRWVLYLYALYWLMPDVRRIPSERLLPAYSLLLLGLGILSIYQFISGDGFSSNPDAPFVWGDYYRATGLFNLPGTFATSIGMSALLALGFLLAGVAPSKPSGGWRQGLVWLGVAAGFVAIGLTMTRSAWLAIGVVVLLLALVMRSHRIWSVLIAAVVLASAAQYFNASLADRVQSIGEADDKSWATRQDIWSANLAMVREAPWFGQGGRQNIDQLAHYYEQLGIDEQTFIGHAHNNLLQIAAGQGLIALVFWLWLCGYFLWLALGLLRRRHEGGVTFAIGLGSLSAQLYFHIIGMADCTFIDLKVNHQLMFLWALTLATSRGSPAAIARAQISPGIVIER